MELLTASQTVRQLTHMNHKNQLRSPQKHLQIKIKNEKVVLRRSFGFYRGDIHGPHHQNYIHRQRPALYDETWYADFAATLTKKTTLALNTQGRSLLKLKNILKWRYIIHCFSLKRREYQCLQQSQNEAGSPVPSAKSLRLNNTRF